MDLAIKPRLLPFGLSLSKPIKSRQSARRRRWVRDYGAESLARSLALRPAPQ
jgi:hypothetical protein